VRTIFQHWAEGGWGNYPLIPLAVLMLVVAARQSWRLQRAGRHLRVVVPSALESLRASHDVADALSALAALGGSLARAVGAGLAQLPASTAAAESIASTQRNSGLAVLDRRALALPMVAGFATLFGLLGTITGLVPCCCPSGGCGDAASRATMLAKGASESLNCIAFALVLAVVCLALHALLEGWRERLRADAEHAVAHLHAELDALRPYLSFFGARIVDERWSYRGP
jgi:biopolymer transport protein ExbB/TolQ